jgi:hypothetical protein
MLGPLVVYLQETYTLLLLYRNYRLAVSVNYRTATDNISAEN